MWSKICSVRCTEYQRNAPFRRFTTPRILPKGVGRTRFQQNPGTHSKFVDVRALIRLCSPHTSGFSLKFPFSRGHFSDVRFASEVLACSGGARGPPGVGGRTVPDGAAPSSPRHYFPDTAEQRRIRTGFALGGAGAPGI